MPSQILICNGVRDLSNIFRIFHNFANSSFEIVLEHGSPPHPHPDAMGKITWILLDWYIFVRRKVQSTKWCKVHLFHLMRFSDEFGSVGYPHSSTKMEFIQTSVHESTTRSLDALPLDLLLFCFCSECCVRLWKWVKDDVQCGSNHFASSKMELALLDNKSS